MSRRSKGIKIGVRSAVPVSRVNETPGGTNSRSPLSECRSTSLPDRWMVPGVCIFLAAITFVVFGQTLRYEFINFDDDVYVYDNAQICQRLSLSGIEWAFGHSVEFNWHPLTMLSYMLDYQLYGLKAGGYHFTNVLLHGAAAILLFLVLRKMTAALWRSAFVAALFAIHPLRVESVAWVAERKDVLSGVFFMLLIGGVCLVCARSAAVVSLSGGGVLFRAGFDVQADIGDAAICFAVVGLLAFKSLLGYRQRSETYLRSRAGSSWRKSPSLRLPPLCVWSRS